MILLPLIAAAVAALPTFSGIQLGSPPELPICEQKELSFTPLPGTGQFYKSQQPKLCIEPPPTANRPDTAILVFPDGSEPEIAWNHYLDLTIIDGKVEGVRMFTISHNYYQQVVKSLTDKFGKPTSVSRDEVVVADIAVPSRDYVWLRHGYHVDYETINDMESGVLFIETDKAAAWRKQNEATESAKQTKL